MSTFTVLIGSACRPTLVHTLESVARQNLLPGDQCLVGLDALDRTPEELRAATELVHSYGDGFIAKQFIGIAKEEKVIPPGGPYPDGAIIQPGHPYHWLGVEQVNHLMTEVPITGTHLFTLGDDDVFVDGAYRTLRPICDEDPMRPILYRFLAPNGWILWDQPRLRACLISGCCIAAPTSLAPLMHTRIETTHDYDWIAEIVQNANTMGKKPLWLDYVGVMARPPIFPNGTCYHEGVWTCWSCGMSQFRERMYKETSCPNPRCRVDVNLRIIEIPKVVPEVDPETPNAYEPQRF